MDGFRKWAILLSITLLIGSAQAQQTKISVGPQLSLFGIGGGATVFVNDYLSFSGELGFLPLKQVEFPIEDIDFDVDVDVLGGYLGAEFHPFKGNLSIGAGLLFAKNIFDLVSQSLPEITEIGDGEYSRAELGTLVADVDQQGTWPVLMLGWRGKGFNFGLGVAFSDRPDIDIDATGPIASNPLFQADLELYKDEFYNSDYFKYADLFPVFRFGYQFGVSGY